MKIRIDYCTVWHYTDRAVSLVNDLLKNFEPQIESVTLVPAQGGRFEVSVNDQLVYSKLQAGRHAEPDEIVGLVRKQITK